MIEQQVCIGGPSVIVTAAWLLDLHLWGCGVRDSGSERQLRRTQPRTTPVSAGTRLSDVLTEEGEWTANPQPARLYWGLSYASACFTE